MGWCCGLDGRAAEEALVSVLLIVESIVHGHMPRDRLLSCCFECIRLVDVGLEGNAADECFCTRIANREYPIYKEILSNGDPKIKDFDCTELIIVAGLLQPRDTS